MGGDLVRAGPIIPPTVLWPTLLVLFAGIVLVCRRQKSVLAIYVIMAVWLRYVLSALHTYTFDDAFAGLSWNALASVAIFGIGLLLIDKRLLMHRALVPVWFIISLIVVSGIVNGQTSGIVNTVVKYGYFVVIMVAIYQVMREGNEEFLSWLLWAFAPLVVFQILSIALGVAKATEADGSVSYIGGYNHEAAFSLSLAAAVFTACFARRLGVGLCVAILTVLLIGLYLANYRTAIIAIAPLIAAQFIASGSSSVRPDQRPLVTLVVAAVAVLALAGSALLLGDRLADLGLAAERGLNIIKPPGEFTYEDRQIMSARPYIWSTYVYAFDAGTPVQHLVGFGADSWVGLFRVYAHNTIVSYLYELGWLGVLAIILLWSTMLLRALQTSSDVRTKLVWGHVSFFLINMATMPHWMIEGLIIYAILCGYTLYENERALVSRRSSGTVAQRLGGVGRTHPLGAAS